MGANTVNFTPSLSNNLSITSATASGWSAVVSNSAYNSGSSYCGVYVGAGFSATGAAAEGVPGCQ
jgi:hypothetical protein